MLKHVITAFFAILPFLINAQTDISYSNSFPEPRKGWNKILIMKNGNTAYVHNNGGTMHLRLYGKDRKLIKDRNIPYKGSVKGGVVGEKDECKDMFEQNGNIVVLMTTDDDCGMGGYINCVKSLYRIVIDPVEAKILQGDKLCSAAKVRSWGYNLSYMTLNDIFVTRDPVSDMYAVLEFSGYTEKKDKPDRIKLMTYDGENKLLKTVVLNAPSTEDKAVHFAGLCMYDKTVYLGTNMRNKKEKGLEVPLCISVLKNDADNFETTVFDIKPFGINSDNQLLYNLGSQTLQMLTTTETDKDTKHGFLIAYATTTTYQATGISQIDVNTMTIKSTVGLDYSIADEYAKQKLGDEDGFGGNSPVFYLNSDNTITVIPENRYTVTKGNPGGVSMKTDSYVSKIGLIKLDENSKAMESMVMRIREVGGATNGQAAKYYFDYKYINTPTASYIVLNDLPENFDKPETVKPHKMLTISDGNTILYKVADGEVEKSYLWGTPEKKRDNKFAIIGETTYDENSKTWATIKVNGLDKKACVAWVTFQ